MSPLTLTAIVVTLGFASGLNVYATALALGILARLHWAVLPGTLGAVANPWVMGVCAILFVAEFVADKIPGFDIVWNLLQTFVRIPVAAMMAYAATSQLSPELRLVITAAGAGFAALAHTAKTVPRLAVLPSPEPISNITLSSAEDVAVLSLVSLVMAHPWIIGSTVTGLAVLAVVLLVVAGRAASRGLSRLWRKRAPAPPAQAKAALPHVR